MAAKTKKNVTVSKDTKENKNDFLPEASEELTPSQYFDILKEQSVKADKKAFMQLYENTMALMNKYVVTGQKKGAIKLYHFAQLCEKEIRAIEAGIDVYVERAAVDDYISKIAKKTVVIIELENYERDIPDDVVARIAELKEQKIFDKYYVVFTDYTGKERKKVAKEKRERDPILFGVMKIGDQISTRLYHVASWEDEFCDLTLDKMVKEYDASKKKDGEKGVKMKTKLSEFGSLEEFKAALDASSK